MKPLVEYRVERRGGHYEHVGSISARSPREAAEEALQWVGGLDDPWQSWTLVRVSDNQEVAWSSATEDGVALVFAESD